MNTVPYALKCVTKVKPHVKRADHNKNRRKKKDEEEKLYVRAWEPLWLGLVCRPRQGVWHTDYGRVSPGRIKLFLRDHSDRVGWQPGGHRRPFRRFGRAGSGLHQGASRRKGEDSSGVFF